MMSCPYPPVSRGHAAATLDLAVVSETWPPEVNGVAHTLERLVEGLRARGHRVRVVRPRQPADRLPEDPAVMAKEWLSADITLPGCPIPGYRGLQLGLPAGRRLHRLWSRYRPDLVYVATQGPLGHSAVAAARRLRVPVVSGFHTRFDSYARHYGMGLLMPLARLLLKRFHNRCAATLVPTRTLAEELGARGFERVGVLGRGVDTRRFTPARRARSLRAQWGAGRDTPVVLHVGRLAPEKNLPLAIAAFRALQARLPQARLVLVGDGPLRARLERAHPDVILAGEKTGQALAQHYASADLFLFPSLSETFGNVLLEAMASGLPVLAFDTAAAHEHLGDGVHGRRVPVTGVSATDERAFVSAARELADMPEWWPTLGSRGREHAQAQDWCRVVEEFEAIVRGTLPTEVRDAHVPAHG